jgi:hypothetical protein
MPRGDAVYFDYDLYLPFYLQFILASGRRKRSAIGQGLSAQHSRQLPPTTDIA